MELIQQRLQIQQEVTNMTSKVASYKIIKHIPQEYSYLLSPEFDREQMERTRSNNKKPGYTDWQKVLEKGQPKFKINPNWVATIDPQFVYGSRLSSVLAMENRTDAGGQPVYHTGLAEAQAQITEQLSIHSQLSPENSSQIYWNSEGRRFENHNPYPGFNHNFSAPLEIIARDTLENDNGVKIYRHPVFPSCNLDKQEVNDEQNAWWENLERFAKETVDTWLEQKEIPSIITLPYAGGAYVGQFIKKYLVEAGVNISKIRFIGHLHSAGMPKLENSINQIIKERGLQGEGVVSAIEEVVTAPHTNFGVRVLSERLLWNDGGVIVNADNEVGLLSSGFYSQSIIGIPSLKSESVIAQPPGIQSHLFYNRQRTEQANRNPAIEAIFEEKKQLLESKIQTLQDPNKPLLYTAARFEQASGQDNKGWYDVLEMYLTNLEVYSQANLLLFADFLDIEKFPDNDKSGKASLAKKMRDLVAEHRGVFDKNVILVTGPNQIELATYNQILAEMAIDTVYIGGSLKEPWGLMAAESANCGNKVVLSKNYNAKQAFEEEEAIYTYTPGNPKEFATAIIETLEDQDLLEKQQKVARDSTWDGVAPKMLEIYQQAPTSNSSGEILIDASNPIDVFFANCLLAAYLVKERAKEIFPDDDENQTQLKSFLSKRYGITYISGVMSPDKEKVGELFRESIKVQIDRNQTKFYQGQGFKLPLE